MDWYRALAFPQLAIFFPKTDNDIQGFPLKVPPRFQSQPEQVHPQDPFFFFAVLVPGIFCLVADHHALVIAPHFESIHPIRFGSQDPIGMACLRDLHPCNCQHFTGGVVSRREPLQRLGLSYGPVTVLCHHMAMASTAHGSWAARVSQESNSCII